MNEVVKFLQDNPVQYLATVGRDGKAKCRPSRSCLSPHGCRRVQEELEIPGT